MSLKEHHQRDWISVGTVDKIRKWKSEKTVINNSQTRTVKFKTQAEYTEVNKRMKKSIKSNLGKYVEDLSVITKKL